ncbi:MAG: SCO family protein [Terricaulis sp.]
MSSAPETPRRGLTGAIVPALAAAGLAGLGTLFLVSRQAEEAAQPPPGCITTQLQAIGGPIDLLDTHGQAVTQADFSSGPAILYFGFTHCPDICPTTLYDLGAALGAPGGYDIQPVFVTLDAERDTPDVMDAYVKSGGFPEGLVGLTGSEEQVRAAAGAFKVAYSRSALEGAPGEYTVNHSSFLYVMDENWRTAAIMPTSAATPEGISACIAAGLGEPS